MAKTLRWVSRNVQEIPLYQKNDQISIFRNVFQPLIDRIRLKLGQKLETINIQYPMERIFENFDFWQNGGHFSIIFRPKFTKQPKNSLKMAAILQKIKFSKIRSIRYQILMVSNFCPSFSPIRSLSGQKTLQKSEIWSFFW